MNVDLFDAEAVRTAVAGSDAVLRLTTKIPGLMRMRDDRAWDETIRLRTEGARILVDAAIAEGVRIYVHESVTFVYRDGGDRWVHEAAPTDDYGPALVCGTLKGEQEALRFQQSGGRAVVLRFGSLYGTEDPSSQAMIRIARMRRLPQIGPGLNYFSPIYTADAGRAVAAALQLPGGIYNIVDDQPIRFTEYLGALIASARAPEPFHLPGFVGGLMFGKTWEYFSRSLRVSNAKLKQASNWKPLVGSAISGWSLIGSQLQRQRERFFAMAH